MTVNKKKIIVQNMLVWGQVWVNGTFNQKAHLTAQWAIISLEDLNHKPQWQGRALAMLQTMEAMQIW